VRIHWSIAMNLLTKSLLLSAALGLAGATSAPVVAHPQASPAAEEGRMQRGMMPRERLARAARTHPQLAVALDLRRLEMLYRKQGDEAAVVAMYQDLLKRTEHPKLRAFAERRLQHAERVAHPEQAITELRARIDRKLAELR